MRNSLTIFVLGLLLSTATTFAYSDGLMDIYLLAEENDPVYLAAISANKSAHEFVNQSRAVYFPSISISASGSATDADDFENIDEIYAATITQPIYNRSNITNHSNNQIFVKQADVDLELAKQNLILRASRRYFNVLSARDSLTFARAERQAIARQLDQAQQRFEVGLVAITDVHEAQARFDLVVAENIAAQNDLNASLESLREITGRYHEHLSTLSRNTPLLPPEPNRIEEWTSQALMHNKSLLSAQFQTRRSLGAIDLQRAGHHPTVNLSASYSSNASISGNTTASEFSEGTRITLNFGMNIFAGGRISSQVRQAEFNHQRSKEILERRTRETQRRVRNAFLSVIAEISRVKALRQAIKSSKSALRASEAGFEVGTRTTVDVLLSRQNLFSAQTNYAQARYRYVDQLLRLKLAAGTLESKDLEEINEWLNL